MARPERNNVDYFPFYCDEGQKMFYIENKYGNDGFACFIKILRELAKKDYHYLNLQDKASRMFLSAKCKVTEETMMCIIEDLVELGKFDKALWSDKIVWCSDFIDSIQDAYSKRNNKCISYEGLLSLLEGLGVRKPSKSKGTGVGKPQSIVEYSIVDKSIEDYIDEIYSSYPSKCPIRKSSTGKSHKDKDRIKTLLKHKSGREVLDSVVAYVSDCSKSNTMLKNFSTLLNNIPDLIVPEPVKPVLKPAIDKNDPYANFYN